MLLDIDLFRHLLDMIRDICIEEEWADLVNGTIKPCLLFLVVIDKYSLTGRTSLASIFSSIRQLLQFVHRLRELKATDRTGG